MTRESFKLPLIQPEALREARLNIFLFRFTLRASLIGGLNTVAFISQALSPVVRSGTVGEVRRFTCEVD